MALRVRVAASACLVASGLFIGAAGGALALADPGDGYGHSDDDTGDDSVGDIVRRAFSPDGGNDRKASETRKHPTSRWGNGRPERATPGEEKPDQPVKPDDPREEDPQPEDPKDPCGDDGDGQPPGLPAPGLPESGGREGGAIVQLPRFEPPRVPDMELPRELQPSQPGGPAVLDAGAGAAAAAAPVGPAAPIGLPVIVVPPLALGGAGGAGSGGASAGTPPGVPRAVTAEPPAGRIAPPANAGSNAAVTNGLYRIGYTEYLRTAGLPQVAALAVPGLAGILVLTGAGGLMGYRQAKAGHAVRVGGSARFMR